MLRTDRTPHCFSLASNIATVKNKGIHSPPPLHILPHPHIHIVAELLLRSDRNATFVSSPVLYVIILALPRIVRDSNLRARLSTYMVEYVELLGVRRPRALTMEGAPLPAAPPLAAPIHPADAPKHKRKRCRQKCASIPPADAPTTKRIRLRSKSRDAVALPMMHTRVETQDSVSDGRAEPGVWPQRDKITEWYAHPASLLEDFPLSDDAIECRKAHPVIEGSPSLRHMRDLMRTLDVTIAHSFEYKGKWHSLQACHLATFYEDRALHMVGERRIQDWWAARPLSDRSETRTGVALTFWFSLNDAPRVPDAIEVGLTSTLLAEFEAVFLLAYQRFDNVPEHIHVIDGNKVMPETSLGLYSLATRKRAVSSPS